MKNQFGWVEMTVTNLDRAVNHYPAILGEPIKIQPAQDLVFAFAPPTSRKIEMRQCKT